MATLCCGPSATGDGSGSDWNNIKAKPSSTGWVRGNTYYFSDGTKAQYGDLVCNQALSGTTRITIKKAIESDHGPSTGWSSALGDGQAVFTLVSLSRGYITFDGQTGGGPGSWKTGFGFVIDTSAQTSSNAYPALFLGEIPQASTTGIIAQHFEVIGNGGDGTSSSGQTNDAVASWGSVDTTISYYYAHDMGRCIYIFLSGVGGVTTQNVTLEYGYTDQYEYTAGEHSEILSSNGGPYTIRYNIFAFATGTGGLMFNRASGNQYVYGNVFFHSTGDTGWGYAANGLIGSKDSGEPVVGVLVYNNTFYNPFADSAGAGPQIFGSYMDSTSESKNNLFYGHQPSSATYNTPTHDYNLYQAMTGASAPTETNRQVATGNPFTDAENLDFRLTANSNAGVNLGSPYDVDMLGNTRTSWTRGAIEFETVTRNLTYSGTLTATSITIG